MGAFRGKLCPQIFRILANKAERRQTKNPLNTLYFSEFLHFREYQRERGIRTRVIPHGYWLRKECCDVAAKNCFYPLFLWIRIGKRGNLSDSTITCNGCSNHEHLTNNALAGHTDRTTSKSGFRPVSHADIFLPAHSGYAVHNGQVERPIYLNKARRLLPVVETCPPSIWRANTKAKGGHHG